MVKRLKDIIKGKKSEGERKPRSLMKRLLIWLVWIVASPFLIFLLLVILLYIPPVQQWAVNTVARIASDETGWDIRLEQVRLKFPLDLDLRQLSVLCPDTMLNVGSVTVGVDCSHILKAKVGVRTIDIKDGTVDTQDLIASLRVRGYIGDFHLNADCIDLKQQTVDLTAASLRGSAVSLELQDTTVVDTTESEPVDWLIRLGKVEVKDTRVAFHLPGDTMSVSGYVSRLGIEGGNIDLGQGVYEVEAVGLRANALAYDMNYEPYLTGLDYNHIFLSDLTAAVQDVRYAGDSLSLYLSDLSAVEKSGLKLSQLRTHFYMTGEGISVPDLLLATPYSTATATAALDWDALEAGGGGSLKAELSLSVGMGDVAIVLPEYAPLLPDAPLEVEARAEGNVDRLALESLSLSVAPMLSLRASGSASNLLDTDRIGLGLDFEAETYDLSLVNRVAELGNSVYFPRMSLSGEASLEGGACQASLNLREGEGRVGVKASYDMQAESYRAVLDIRDLRVSDFLPEDTLIAVSASLKAAGVGTDVFSPYTRLAAAVELDSLTYGGFSLGGLGLKARLLQGQATVNLDYDNGYAEAQAELTAELGRDSIAATMDFDLQKADLQALGLMDKPLTVATKLNIEAQSNLRDTHCLEGGISGIALTARDSTFRPKDLSLALGMLPDSLYICAASGDLALNVSSREGLDSLLAKTGELGAELERQLSNYEIDQQALKQLLPTLALSLRMGRENPVHSVLYAMTGYRFDSFSLEVESSRANGLYADGRLAELNTGGILIDTIRLDAYQDMLGVLNANVHVANNQRNRQVVFSADLLTSLKPRGVSAMIEFTDAEGRKGVELGASLDVEDEGLKLRLQPLNPVVAYRDFTLNDGNFLYLGRDKRIDADVDLLSDDGTGLRIYSTENATALNDLTVSLENVNIGEITALLPYMPDIKGMLDADVHLVQEEEQLSVSVDASVEGLVYEDTPMGDIGADILYLPNADGTQFVDGVLTYEGDEIVQLRGTYDPADDGSIDAEAKLLQLPLSLANGFIPDKMAALEGYAQAELKVKGPLSSPLINGYLATDSLRLYSDMYSVDFRFPDDTIRVEDNYLSLNRIEAYSTGSTPLVLDGNVDCRKLDNISLDLSVEAKNFELINAPKSKKAVAYGKVFVDMLAKVSGTLNDLSIKGALTLLGNTDVTYVLTDSPLSEDNQLSELVEFVDFNAVEEEDTLQKAKPQNIDMDMYLSIEQTAQVHCLLSQDGSNYIDLEGGGDFTMTYDQLNGISLYGRYTVVSGVMNYSIMVLSLKDCNIESGSYVEFMGNVLNPRLNLTATERIKSTVTENSVPRTVAFDVGVSITQTLENLGLEFNLDAPEDMTISNQLATLTAEGRSKTAVTLLVTGVYISEDGTSGGFNGSNALNAFLQSQISSISNKALSSVDLSFDVDNTTTASGGSQTDYNFSFAKHFWGNRISVIIGGKVSSGDDVENTGQSIIDNVSIEYRLDSSATRYVRVYYDKSTESIMEGEITEMGAGIVLRKKSNRLGELFIFKKKNKI